MAQTSRVHKRNHANKLQSIFKRFGVSKRWGVACACILLLVLFCCFGLFWQGSSGVVLHRNTPEKTTDTNNVASTLSEESASKSEGETESNSQQASTSKLYVHVDGAVVSPGVYEFSSGSRVCDALDAAGGLAEDADTSQINLAAQIIDGEKVYVPHEGETVTNITSPETNDTARSGLVNINTATVEQLDTLPGVGEATATAIIEDREQNGPFTSPEDLMRVSGIGEKKFERLEGLICV